MEQHKARLRGEEISRRSAERKRTDNETLLTYSVLVQPWQEKFGNETMQDMGIIREDTIKSHRSNITKEMTEEINQVLQEVEDKQAKVQAERYQRLEEIEEREKRGALWKNDLMRRFALEECVK